MTRDTTAPSSSAAPTSMPTKRSLLQRLWDWFHHIEREPRPWERRVDSPDVIVTLADVVREHLDAPDVVSFLHAAAVDGDALRSELARLPLFNELDTVVRVRRHAAIGVPSRIAVRTFVAALREPGPINAAFARLAGRMVDDVWAAWLTAQSLTQDDDLEDGAEATIVDLVALNDDATPADWVSNVFRSVLQLERAHAEELMWKVHHEGEAVILSGSPADMRHVRDALEVLAVGQRHPFRCVLRRQGR